MNYQRIMPSPVDRSFFQTCLAPFLPDTIFDSHIHIWERQHRAAGRFLQRGEDWAEKIEQENPFEALKQDIAQLLPGKEVFGLLMGWVGATVDISANNRYVGRVVRENPGWHGLAVTSPAWTREETLRQIEDNGLAGMKPYITFAPESIATEDIAIFDMLTPVQWQLAHERNYVCLLHLPRPGRLADRTNIGQLLEIERDYPGARVIVAHIGRCYSEENLGDALECLKDTRRMCFDFSGNTNARVILRALEAFGPERILYGSDLPLTHIHLKRIYEHGHYVNLIDARERPQINGAAYMRPMPDADTYTFYLYESLCAFRDAALELGLSAREIQRVLCDNAQSILCR